MKNDIRWLLLNFPEKALDEPSSLEVVLGAELPSDVSFQLKVRLSSLRSSKTQQPKTKKRGEADFTSIYYIGQQSIPRKL
jgi:hypothetical protein